MNVDDQSKKEINLTLRRNEGCELTGLGCRAISVERFAGWLAGWLAG